MKTISVTNMKELRVLIIWSSGIKEVDISNLEFMELVICGYWYGGRLNGRQVVKIRNGVVKRVLDPYGKHYK